MSNIDPTVTEPKVEPTTQEPGTTEPTQLNESSVVDYFNDNPQIFEK